MEGAGCLAVIAGFILWALLAAFLGVGMPVIGLIVGLVLWRDDREVGGLITLLSVIALAAVIPALMEGDYLSGSSYLFAVVVQIALTVVLVLYALFSTRRYEDPRTTGYQLVAVAAVFGVLWNLLVFGVPWAIEMMAQ